MDNLKERVTIYEVAKASGVSLATVSRVINNTGTVKEETKNKDGSYSLQFPVFQTVRFDKTEPNV